MTLCVFTGMLLLMPALLGLALVGLLVAWLSCLLLAGVMYAWQGFLGLLGRVAGWGLSASCLVLAAALFAGCAADVRELCPAEFVHRDPRDVRVFMSVTGVDAHDFCVSASLRAQYDRWARGEYAVDGNAVKARRAAESAEAMSALSLGMSVGSGAR